LDSLKSMGKKFPEIKEEPDYKKAIKLLGKILDTL
jgi:hypothetical protein